MSRRRRFAFLIAMLIAVPLAAVVAVALFGVSIDASRWRDLAAQRAATALGRPVALGGAFELRLGREPGFRIGHVQILNPPGFKGQQFLAIGELRADVDLLDALRGRLRLRHIEASDVDLSLERAADGSDNWTSTAQGDAAPSQAGIDIDQVTLNRTGVHYHDARSATRRDIELDQLSATVGRDTPLRLAARGRMEPLLPSMSLRLEGGPLRLLLEDAEPWPFTLDFQTDGARLHASGALATGQRTARLRFDAHADDPAPIERLLGTKLPQLGRAALRGTLSAEADSVRVSELHGWLGESEMSGQLALALGGARPRLSGALSAAALDLRPWLAAQPDDQDRVADGNATARQTLPLRELSVIDVEVDVKVERWLGPGVEVRDASFAFRADRQGLRVPMSATLAGVPFAGSLAARHRGADPDLRPPARSRTMPCSAAGTGAGLRQRHRGHARAPGPAPGRPRRDAGTAGARPGAVAFGRGRAAEFRPCLGRASDLRLARYAGACAASRRTPARPGTRDRCSVNVRASRCAAAPWPTCCKNRRCRSNSSWRWPRPVCASTAHGPLTGRRARRRCASTCKRRRAGDLARWLPVAPESSLPWSLRGQLRRADEGWALDATTLQLGRSELTIDARRTLADGRPSSRLPCAAR